VKKRNAGLILSAAAVFILILAVCAQAGAAEAPATNAAPSPRAPIYIVGDNSFTPANGVTGGSGTASDPYIIENWAIDASGANGIDIENTTAYFVVRNCLIENATDPYDGIQLYNVNNGVIENNTCENNSNCGIGLYRFSDKNTLTGNTCGNNGRHGIGLYFSFNNTLTGNTCENNYGAGIYLWSYSAPSSGNTLSNNACRNSLVGIFLGCSSGNTLSNNACENNSNYGIYLYSSSDNNTLTGNTCENNYRGIELESSSNNTLTGNICGNNDYIGIYLTSSDNNIISRNYLLNNTENNAYDNGTNRWNNHWDNNEGGNYWSDWQPPAHPDNDNNGIVDNARPIMGGTNQDNYPLVIGYFPPTTTTISSTTTSTTLTTTTTTPTTTAPPSEFWTWVAVGIGVIVVIAIVAWALMRRR
jgi:parallel beta-helix repeat protein